jgi:hypothetical protein
MGRSGRPSLGAPFWLGNTVVNYFHHLSHFAVDVEEGMGKVNAVVAYYKQMVRTVDTCLYTLTTTEHGVLTGVLLLLGSLLWFGGKFLVLLFNILGLGVLACAVYVGYCLSKRLEPRDDYE